MSSFRTLLRTFTHRRRLVQNIGGARSGQSAMTDDIIGVSGAMCNTYKLVRLFSLQCRTYVGLRSCLATISLAIKRKYFAFLQLPALQLILCWVVLILALII